MKRISMTAMLAVFLFGALLAAAAEEHQTLNGTSGRPDLEVDLFNLEEGIPTRIDDANVLPRGAFQVRTSISWGDGDAANWWDGKAEVAAGICNGLQVNAGIVLRQSSLDSRGNGDTYLKALYQAYRAGSDAALVGLEINFPTGQDYARLDTSFPPFVFPVNQRRQRIDYSVLGVYTRKLDSEGEDRVHLEGRYFTANSAPVGFQTHRWFWAVGYDRPLDAKTLGIASVWWEGRPRICEDSSAALQLGIRRKESPRFLWAAGLNLGLGWSVADWGLTVGGQYEL
jgi:hypothetical protein